MERIPVEVVGIILSRIGAARDVVIASATCQKWREARKYYLDTLSFDCSDWPGYNDIGTSRLEMVITQTIFQTFRLKRLTLIMGDVHKFSAASVIAWLRYTRARGRATLRELCYKVATTTNVNILENCGDKLEVLTVRGNFITGVDPRHHNFPCLKSVSLCYVSVSLLDLEHLLTSCPIIEFLMLFETVITDSAATCRKLELSSCSLKEFCIHGIFLDWIELDAPCLEKLFLKNCCVTIFELTGKGSLRELQIDDGGLDLDVGESIESLEVVDIVKLMSFWPEFLRMISNAKNLKELYLQGIGFDDDESDYENDVLELLSISVCCPQLRLLSLCHMSYGRLKCLFRLDSVVELVLGWTTLTDLFSEWVEEMVEKCPKLEKLVIFGDVTGLETRNEIRTLANLTSFIFRLMRRYLHVKVEFDFV